MSGYFGNSLLVNTSGCTFLHPSNADPSTNYHHDPWSCEVYWLRCDEFLSSEIVLVFSIFTCDLFILGQTCIFSLISILEVSVVLVTAEPLGFWCIIYFHLITSGVIMIFRVNALLFHFCFEVDFVCWVWLTYHWVVVGVITTLVILDRDT